MNVRYIVGVTVVVLATTAVAVLAYFLIDILLLLFLGIVVAAALQPWHVKLCGWGVPKGAAVLVIYLFFLLNLVLIGILIGPVIVEQVTTFAAGLPEAYAQLRSSLEGNQALPLRLIGQRLPPFARLADLLTDVQTTFFRGVFGLTTTVLGLFAYVLSVLAIAFYWTLELPRVERLVLSFVPVSRRTHALNIWHEIEYKLGAFMRAQGIAMLAIGVASGVGYALIGLPNVLVLAVLAGLLEAVPLLGPVLAAVPAVLVALPLGLAKVLWVVGLATVIQAIENNVLMPRLMSQAVGVSALVGLVAVLAFGTLYGVLGVFIAIPITAVIQVLLDQMVINAEPVTEIPSPAASPWAALRARVAAIRHQARIRMRGRETRMGIDPASPDHVVDAVDQRIEEALDRVDKMITVAAGAGAGAPVTPEDDEVVDGLHEAAGDIEQAVEQVETIVAAAEEKPEAGEANVENLDEAAGQINDAVDEVDTMVTAAQKHSDKAQESGRERAPARRRS